jgi:hypothetical protein
MESIGKRSLSFILRIFTDFCIIVNIGVLINLPWLTRYIVKILAMTFVEYEPYIFILVFLYICGVFALGILIQGHLILRTLEKNQPFDAKNSKRFFQIGLMSLFIACVFFIKIFMYNTLLTITGTGFFALAALIAFILSDVFLKAAKIWEEHELTV